MAVGRPLLDGVGWPPGAGIQANPGAADAEGGREPALSRRKRRGAQAAEKSLYACMRPELPVPHTDTGGQGQVPRGGRAILR